MVDRFLDSIHVPDPGRPFALISMSDLFSLVPRELPRVRRVRFYDEPFRDGRSTSLSRALTGTILQAKFRGLNVMLSVLKATEIGRGAEGEVFAAKVEIVSGAPFQRLTVAIKAVSANTDEKKNALARQTRLWGGLNHPDVLPLLGVANLNPAGTLVGLISPLQNGRDIDAIPADTPVAAISRLVSVAKGLEYLHNEAGVVHGDLKAENLLLGDDGRIVICDFGLSTYAGDQENPTLTDIRIKNTLRFAAPEVLADAARADPAGAPLRSKTTYSDIYAFGSLISQVHMGHAPWAELSDQEVVMAITSGRIPPREDTTPNERQIPISDELWELCQRCWDRDTRRRPTATQLVESLEAMLPAVYDEID